MSEPVFCDYKIALMKNFVYCCFFIFVFPFWKGYGWAVFSQVEDDSTFLKKISGLEKNIVQYQSEINEINEQIEQLKLENYHNKIVRYALPEHKEKDPVIHHKAMTLLYDEKHEQARWVAHLVTKDVEKGIIGRSNDFRSDPLVLTGTANKDDYWNSGYDRGHLAPSADFRWSKTALSESYYYSNMSPQKPEFNRERWAELENFVREWAIMNEEIFLVTGGVLQDGLPAIKGSTSVSIPRYFYKVIADYKLPEIKGIAFIMPNDSCKKEVLEYAVTIDSVQKLTGINFFAELPLQHQEMLEKSMNPELWKNKEKGEMIPDAEPLPSKFGRYNTEEARNQIGKNCKICGTVVSVKYAEKSKGAPTHLNLDKKFPNSVFSVTIWGSDRKNFSYAPEKELPGKKICVKGKVIQYKKAAEVIITNEKQIEFLDEED